MAKINVLESNVYNRISAGGVVARPASEGNGKMVQENCVAPPLLFVVGPTACGKSELGMMLAERLGTDIISCDSMQVYRGMDIGTAKPAEQERRRVAHRLIDITDIDSEFTVADYREYALAQIVEMHARGKTPLFVGGTGLYVNSLIFGYDFASASKSDEIRERLEAEYYALGAEVLYSRLTKIDPASAAEMHPNNMKRVIRALEIYELTGKTKTQTKQPLVAQFPYLAIFVSRERDELYRRIDERVDRMVECGLLEEVRRLLECGYSRSLTAMQGIGYKEIAGYWDGECDLETAIAEVKQHSRNYAKRQITWFKKLPGAIELRLGDHPENAVDDILEKYRALSV